MNPLDVLQQDAVLAAPGLLGWRLMSRLGGAVTGGVIIETEAYHGAIDPASHAFRGPTPRTTPMFQSAGTLYVYLGYGLHYCLNLVTGPAGEAQAVLLRALCPTDGLEIMSRRRGGAPRERLTNGPANLTQALGISLAQTGGRLGADLWLQPSIEPTHGQVVAGPRVGIRQGIDLPWRFRLVGPTISR